MKKISFRNFLHGVVELLMDFLCGRPEDNRLTLGEKKIMIIVKDDNPDVGFSVSFLVTDSEGNEVPATDLSVSVESDDLSVLEVTPAADGLSGSVHFGNPGNATCLVSVKKLDGTLIGSFSEEFTVTTGDPSAISGGTITFDGLSSV